jgi:heptosyltransferase-2
LKFKAFPFTLNRELEHENRLKTTQPLQKILIISLSGIGDAVMFSPALRLLRQTYPDATIDLLCMFKGVQEIFQRNTDINTIYFWNFLKEAPLASLRFVLGLRGNYDASISTYPANRWEYNFISFLAGARKRLGHNYNHFNFASLPFLNTHRVQEDDRLHNVEENVKLAELLGVDGSVELPPLQVNLTDADNTNADAWLTQNGLEKISLFIGLHAGSAEFKNQIKRRWSLEKYAALGLQLMKEKNATILLFGGPDELALNKQINALMENRGHIVQSAFMTTAALMKRCSLFVCNDTGLMHVAAGLQVPTVTIFAFTNPAYVYPWKNRHVLVRHPMECSPCFYYSPRSANCKWTEDRFRCITHIEVEEVWQAVEKMIGE